MSGSRSGLLDPVLERVKPLLQKERDPASFGPKVAPSLKGVDQSFMYSVTGSVCRAKFSNVVQVTRSKAFKLCILITIVNNFCFNYLCE